MRRERLRGDHLLKCRLDLSMLAIIAIMLCSSAVANAKGGCTRETLHKLADTYVKAQSAGKPGMLPFAANSSYAENDRTMEVSKGVLAGPLNVDFTRSFYDTTQCIALTELVAATDPHPYVILARMEATKNGKVSKMESVVTHEGDWAFGASKYLEVTKSQNWDEIPKDKRDSREVIQAVADAYLDNWGNPEIEVPHGTPCARLEGGMYTGTRNPEGNTCKMGAFPQKINVNHRRYVIDESVGAVVVFHNFPWIDAGLGPDSPGTPSGQMFRVEGGKTRYIHELTVCTTPKCGRGRPPGGPKPASAPAPAAAPAPEGSGAK